MALRGFPFLAGFYSKDVILETARAAYSVPGHFAHLLGTAGAFCTAYYSVRLVALTFLGAPRGHRRVREGVHEAPRPRALPLVLLAVGSILVGWLGRDRFIGLGTPFWGSAVFTHPAHLLALDGEFLPAGTKLVPVAFSLAGAGSAAWLFRRAPAALVGLKLGAGRRLHLFFNRSWLWNKVTAENLVQVSLEAGYHQTYKTSGPRPPGDPRPPRPGPGAPAAGRCPGRQADRPPLPLCPEEAPSGPASASAWPGPAGPAVDGRVLVLRLGLAGFAVVHRTCSESEYDAERQARGRREVHGQAECPGGRPVGGRGPGLPPAAGPGGPQAGRGPDPVLGPGPGPALAAGPPARGRGRPPAEAAEVRGPPAGPLGQGQPGRRHWSWSRRTAGGGRPRPRPGPASAGSPCSWPGSEGPPGQSPGKVRNFPVRFP